MPLGSVSLRGVLTTPIGLLDGARHAYLDDGTGGIGLSLIRSAVAPRRNGHQVVGLLTSRSGELTLEVAPQRTSSCSGRPHRPLQVATGLACEPFEARLVQVQGTLVADPGQGADGLMASLTMAGTLARLRRDVRHWGGCWSMGRAFDSSVYSARSLTNLPSAGSSCARWPTSS